MQGGKCELTSCRGTVQSAWQKPLVRRKEEEPDCPQGQVVATWNGDDRPHLSWHAPRRTGKAGENGHFSGEMGGSSPWRRPSAPRCGDTLKVPASRRLDLGWGSSSKTAPGSLSTGSPAGPLHGGGSMYSQAYVRAGESCNSQLERSRP